MTPVPRIGFLDKSLRQFLMMGLNRISVQMLREISEQAHDKNQVVVESSVTNLNPSVEKCKTNANMVFLDGIWDFSLTR